MPQCALNSGTFGGYLVIGSKRGESSRIAAALAHRWWDFHALDLQSLHMYIFKTFFGIFFLKGLFLGDELN